MKSLPYLSETKRDEVKSAICDEAEAIIESGVDLSDSAHLDDVAERDKPPPSKKSKKSKGEYKLMEFIGDIIDPDDQEQTITAYQKANSEVKRYQDAAVTTDEKEEHPLTWWKYNAVRYPILSKLAKKYLAIPATSVPSERAFSIAGHVSNVKRACLLPASVNMLVFLAENLQ
ncbi:E3 SUMO-protein ligase ZBED1-like [Dysidea avara]|uniref:E3 SUMO-protein ligase ZBED1-like n=1 Tax=Dysidea avara TaxID=196820 RepID=UPI00331C9310